MVLVGGGLWQPSKNEKPARAYRGPKTGKGTPMTEHRVVFDFEIDFSNGGGIQGQGFRLDIDGDDIADADLADYIVKDMRLLMVGEVRILNKQIIQEAHKRGAADVPQVD
jgi:hypothetical protein